MKAACEGQDPAIFFEDRWEIPRSLALANAREFCDTCPVRVACLKMAMSIEKNDAVDYRAGIFGGMTPEQRHSLHKRGYGLSCECGVDYDPTELRAGLVHCRCGERRVAAIPDRGDNWTERHTKLARIMIGWLADNVEVGGTVPDALALSRQLKCGVKDMRRIYKALLEDHVLLKLRGKIVRRQTNASAKHWTPMHMRDGLAS